MLRPDQCASAARVGDAIVRHGGCLLADDVGRGKTYVALAVARAWRRPLVVVPAGLRATWGHAMERAGVACALVSHEELSRGRLPRDLPDGIVVDESHHFRSTHTRRYSALATLAAGARLLLLSATPLQNRVRDLAAQVALFHGERAFALDAAGLASFVVRGRAPEHGLLPEVAPPRWAYPAVDDAGVLEAILALPSPARPFDGGDPGVLRAIGLVKAWASSRAALHAAIRRRRRVAAAIESSAAEGRAPTRRELAAWQEVDGATQLGFASVLATGGVDPEHAVELLEAVALEHTALRALDWAMAATLDPDDARVALLHEIRSTHPGERLLAFTEFAATAESYFRRLRGAAGVGVGVLTSREGRIASGRLSRNALLARFAPRARRAPRPLEREGVTLLLATDLLSEGVDLQDASVVVHLDLPWNPARLAQRVGRVRRPGGAAVVHSYLVAPPAGAALLLDVERRLRDKLGTAARAVGRGFDVVPSLVSTPTAASPDAEGRATRWGEAMARIARWARPRSGGAGVRVARTIAAAVDCDEAGWLAALDDGRLLASFGGGLPTTDVETLARVVRLCDGPSRPIVRGEADRFLAECHRWMNAELLARQCGWVAASRASERLLDRRVATALERTPRHLRASAVARASQLIATASVPRPLGAERALRRLLDDAAGGVDSRWLDRAAELTAPSSRERAEPAGSDARVVALIVVGRESGG